MLIVASFKRRLFESLDEKGAEWVSALWMVAWCVALAWPGDTLSGSAYAAFHRAPFMTESFWAGVFGLVGGVRITALYLNGDIKRGPTLRIISSAFGFVSWIQVALLLMEGGYFATSIMTAGPLGYGILALFDLYSLVRVASDTRYERS